ncbi:unnamed protein product [Closterium sp. Naga37s-1]|nr:unnamed protein product [Closterium sp. Naga37s-1]
MLPITSPIPHDSPLAPPPPPASDVSAQDKAESAAAAKEKAEEEEGPPHKADEGEGESPSPIPRMHVGVPLPIQPGSSLPSLKAKPSLLQKPVVPAAQPQGLQSTFEAPQKAQPQGQQSTGAAHSVASREFKEGLGSHYFTQQPHVFKTTVAVAFVPPRPAAAAPAAAAPAAPAAAAAAAPPAAAPPAVPAPTAPPAPRAPLAPLAPAAALESPASVSEPSTDQATAALSKPQLPSLDIPKPANDVRQAKASFIDQSDDMPVLQARPKPVRPGSSSGEAQPLSPSVLSSRPVRVFRPLGTPREDAYMERANNGAAAQGRVPAPVHVEPTGGVYSEGHVAGLASKGIEGRRVGGTSEGEEQMGVEGSERGRVGYSVTREEGEKGKVVVAGGRRWRREGGVWKEGVAGEAEEGRDVREEGREQRGDSVAGMVRAGTVTGTVTGRVTATVTGTVTSLVAEGTEAETGIRGAERVREEGLRAGEGVRRPEWVSEQEGLRRKRGGAERGATGRGAAAAAAAAAAATATSTIPKSAFSKSASSKSGRFKSAVSKAAAAAAMSKTGISGAEKREHRRTSKAERRAAREAAANASAPTRAEIIEVGKAGMAVKDLAGLLAVGEGDIVRALFMKGVITNVNQVLNEDMVAVVCGEYGVEVLGPQEGGVEESARKVREFVGEEDREHLVPRPPVVTVMGHVDHGKVSSYVLWDTYVHFTMKHLVPRPPVVTVMGHVDHGKVSETHEVTSFELTQVSPPEEDREHLVPRPPVVTVMGHVDHGKVSHVDHGKVSHVDNGKVSHVDNGKASGAAAACCDCDGSRGPWEGEPLCILWDKGSMGYLVPRPPVVTVMGHVDHGKTSLLDYIRHTKVAAGEAGGITQAIGAYRVHVPSAALAAADGAAANGATRGAGGDDAAAAERAAAETCVFLDTPGHEAFSAMRARGARVTDIAVVVVAADDGVMPQTTEAIAHARAANVPMLIAINKIDREGASVERVKQQLGQAGVLPEEWGGDNPMVPVSAKTGEGVDQLLETIMLLAELQDLRANPNRPAVGTVIEARLDRHRGPVATLLVQNGTLKLGDVVVCGEAYGKVRALVNNVGKKAREAGPSAAVQVEGLSRVPVAGDEFLVLPCIDAARAMAEEAAEKARAARLAAMQGEAKGSVEAIREALSALPQDTVSLRFLLQAPGDVSSSDVDLAASSSAVVLAFNVGVSPAVAAAADMRGVRVRQHRVIYDVVEEVRAIMEGLLHTVEESSFLGRAEVRAVFGTGSTRVAGVMVTEGRLQKGCTIVVRRGGGRGGSGRGGGAGAMAAEQEKGKSVKGKREKAGEATGIKQQQQQQLQQHLEGRWVHSGQVTSLRRVKEHVGEVVSGLECGVGVEGFNGWQQGDYIEAYEVTHRARTLEDASKEIARVVEGKRGTQGMDMS